MNGSKVGQTIGKYKILELLGRGGMAEVYKGYQENLERFVAIKIMHSFLASEPDFLRRFEREARAMASLNHPNIVGVYDFDIIDDNYYIVMEYVSQGTLKEKLEAMANKGERLPLQAAIRYTLEIADALAYAHSRGMFHRDIKPANIIINERDAAILTDFGIAKMVSGPSHTATGSMIGTPAYMSPEQGLGKPGDLRSDIYALGVLFFQMATGRMPYDADTPLGIVMKHVNEPVPNPSDFNTVLPAGIREVIIKAMAKNPDDRYQTAHDMARDLRAAVRNSNAADLTGALPAALLQDRPTPPPARPDTTPLPVEATRLAGAAEATQVAGHQATQIAQPRLDRTQVVAAPERQAEASGGSGRKWLFAGGGALLLLLIVGGIAAAIFLPDMLAGSPTPTNAALVAATTTPSATPEEVETEAGSGVLNA
ncbi:MAG: serine/threonine protein kinase, partial [Anaerolineales bacterium]|nr:serine/threonine protein kinase [Anaerolineales bacterium]